MTDFGTPSVFEITALILFVLAVVHTFLVKKFQHLALKFPEGSVGENVFHLLGEVEIVFGLWAGFFLLMTWGYSGSDFVLQYLNSRNFTESVFVFVIMAVCSTRPILTVAESFIEFVSDKIPMPKTMSRYCMTLIIGPLLGSFITEPAAMTISALLLVKYFYELESDFAKRFFISDKLKYATLGLLFVNVSIGGTLTPYAAPPVLMVAGTWGWDLGFMLTHFGWEAALSIFVSTMSVAFIFRNEFLNLEKNISNFKNTTSANSNSNYENKNNIDKKLKIPIWVQGIHLLFLSAIVLSAHHMVIFVGVFLFFLGLVSVTKEYQSELKLKESLLVGFFLAGLVIIGGPQRWWLEPILTQLSTVPLYLGAMSLTAITDNAALTYLGSLVAGLTDLSKYALVAGSVVGGGLTVIANAPNPAGFGILNPYFGKEGISPGKLFLAALGPTIVAAIIFWPR